LRTFVAQIEYSHHRKVSRKDTPDLLFGRRKTSFGRHKGCISHISIHSVRLVAISTFVFLGQKNHKMHIAHLDRFRSVGRCAISHFCISWPDKLQDAYRTFRSIPFGWLRYPLLYFLARKITRCISHIWTHVGNNTGETYTGRIGLAH
jgi:hypothetical protein